MHKVIIETEDGTRELIGTVVEISEKIDTIPSGGSLETGRIDAPRTGTGSLSVTIKYNNGPVGVPNG